MKMIAVFAIFGVLTASIASGAEEPMQQCQLIEEKNPNHFYFGPEVLWYQLNTRVKDIKVYGTRFFWGFRLGYEYLKPKAFYAGVDLLGTSSETDFKASKNGQHLSWHKADRGFGNVEIRFGYTFAPTNRLVTPFLGFGTYNVYAIDHHNHQGFEEALPYFAGGIRSKYAFNPTFDLGLNIKILRTVGAEQRFKFEGGKSKEHNNMWGGEIGVPFVWHVGSTKRWDIQLEPYFLKLDFSEVQNIYGTRLLFGYRF